VEGQKDDREHVYDQQGMQAPRFQGGQCPVLQFLHAAWGVDWRGRLKDEAKQFAV